MVKIVTKEIINFQTRYHFTEEEYLQLHKDHFYYEGLMLLPKTLSFKCEDFDVYDYSNMFGSHVFGVINGKPKFIFGETEIYFDEGQYWFIAYDHNNRIIKFKKPLGDFLMVAARKNGDL